jgi:hypothetical protein
MRPECLKYCADPFGHLNAAIHFGWATSRIYKTGKQFADPIRPVSCGVYPDGPYGPSSGLNIFNEGFLMSGNPKQIFHGISRAIFARLRRKASKFGIRVAGTKGEAVKDGVVIQWNYDPGAELLEVECRAPFWLNSAQVNRNLRNEIEVILRSTRAA